jgi:DNA-binding MarR family transcriptional regulator
MQPLQKGTVAGVSAERCARELLASAPAIMRFIRGQMRAHRRVELTVPQFRALVFAKHYEDGSLSDLAEQLGLSLPATSRLVQVLVQRGLLRRGARSSDRRCIKLSLTTRGRASFRAAQNATLAALAKRLEALPAAERGLVHAALEVLNRVFLAESGRCAGAK